MSLNAFKEALKPCKSTLLSSQSTSSSQNSLGFDPSIPPRKPPKSSLSRQLLRLHEDADFLLPHQLKISKPEPNLNAESANDKCEEEKETDIRPRDFKLESFRSFDPTGPYEPLVLALPGEIPAVQVIFQVPIWL